MNPFKKEWKPMCEKVFGRGMQRICMDFVGFAGTVRFPPGERVWETNKEGEKEIEYHTRQV